ncbi:hypothetical protein [Alicyclobacillus fodiniaquatilis]|uniref:Uncharacterized protein n=1 Tax=Alicyclobacillus fodiniaquatilis TaxID=1661150 RepID=A0ABW4JKM5_9BACL
MARPKKPQNERQTEKIVLYVTPDTKLEAMQAAEGLGISESQLGEMSMKRYFSSLKQGATPVEYEMMKSELIATGPVKDEDILRQRKALDLSFVYEDEEWEGFIRWFVNHGSHVEFTVQGRGTGFTCIAGQTLSGYFLAIPTYQVCMSLAEPSDTLYNKEKALSCSGLNRIDGLTAVYALQALNEAGYLR